MSVNRCVCGGGIPDGECDCDGNVDDCAGVCGGTSWESECGCVAVDNSGDECDDCAGTPNGELEIDDCGVCDGGNADDLGCGCFQPAPTGCDNQCGSSLENDECGVCDGDNSSCSDCAGVPNGDSVLDECGECDGDDSSCSGCIDNSALNYDPQATINDSSCEYAPEYNGPDWYVSTDGNDTSGNGSSDFPFASISTALLRSGCHGYIFTFIYYFEYICCNRKTWF